MPILAESSMEVDVELVSIECIMNTSEIVSQIRLFRKRF